MKKSGLQNGVVTSPQVSVLDPACRLKSGAQSSGKILRRADLTPTLLTQEAWSPGLFGGAVRRKDRFERSHVIGLDVDKYLSLSDALIKVKEFKHIVGTTVNHQLVKGSEPACDRFRIVLFTREVITSAEDYKATCLAVSIELGIAHGVDKNAMDGARWFTPCNVIVSTNLTEEAKLAVVSSPLTVSKAVHDGELLTVALGNKLRGRLSTKTADFISGLKGDSPGWRTRFVAAVYDCLEQQYSLDEAQSLLLPGATLGYWLPEDISTMEDIYLNRVGSNPVRIQWPCERLTKEGAPYPAKDRVENMEYLLTEILGYKFSYNVRSGIAFFCKGDGDLIQMYDDLYSELNNEARRVGLLPGSLVEDTVASLTRRAPFDPLATIINSLQWDGVGRFESLFSTLSFAANTPQATLDFYRDCLRCWLIGVMAKFIAPGSQHNVLVFQGAQGIGKSRWLSRLNELWPGYWSEGPIDPSNKDHELYHFDHLVWHISELDSTTRRRDIGALKAFLTKEVITVRRPYDKHPITQKSNCSFCASVNPVEFLNDTTGNRRYSILPITGAIVDHEVDISQVWAEALARARAGETYWTVISKVQEQSVNNQLFTSSEGFEEEARGRIVGGSNWLSLPKIFQVIEPQTVFTLAMRQKLHDILIRKGVPTRVRHETRQFQVDLRRLKLPVKDEEGDDLGNFKSAVECKVLQLDSKGGNRESI